MQRWLFIILTVLAIFVGLTIGLLNPQSVDLDILFTQLTTSAGMVVIGSFACGLLIGIAALWVFRLLPLSIRFKRLQRDVQQLQDQQADNESTSLASLTADQK